MKAWMNGAQIRKRLRLEVVDDLSSKYDKKVEQFEDEGASKELAEAKASNFLLPAYGKS